MPSHRNFSTAVAISMRFWKERSFGPLLRRAVKDAVELLYRVGAGQYCVADVELELAKMEQDRRKARHGG
jgi:hypothetical protein